MSLAPCAPVGIWFSFIVGSGRGDRHPPQQAPQCPPPKVPQWWWVTAHVSDIRFVGGAGQVKSSSHLPNTQKQTPLFERVVVLRRRQHRATETQADGQSIANAEWIADGPLALHMILSRVSCSIQMALRVAIRVLLPLPSLTALKID